MPTQNLSNTVGRAPQKRDCPHHWASRYRILGMNGGFVLTADMRRFQRVDSADLRSSTFCGRSLRLFGNFLSSMPDVVVETEQLADAKHVHNAQRAVELCLSMHGCVCQRSAPRPVTRAQS